MATEIEEFIGKYFSNLYVQKEIFKMTDDDIKEQQKQIKKEEAAGEIDEDPEDEFADGSPEPPAAPKPKPKEKEDEAVADKDKKEEPPKKEEDEDK